MTNVSTIKLMESKLRAYKNGYSRAKASGDEATAEKWKEGCRTIYEEIDRLKHR